MSETILDEIAESTRKRVARDKTTFSLEELKRIYEAKYDDLDRYGNGRFYNALAKPGLSFICEVKKASPSKGIISKDFPSWKLPRNIQLQELTAFHVLQSRSISSEVMTFSLQSENILIHL